MTESLVTVYFSVCCCTTVSERLRSCWGPSRLAHHGDLRHRSEASLRNYIGRPSSEKIRACSDILSDELRGKPHQSLQPSFRALSSRAIFMFPVNSVEKFVFDLSCEKTCMFYQPHFGWSSLNISISDSVSETKNLPAKVSNLTVRTIQVCKL